MKKNRAAGRFAWFLCGLTLALICCAFMLGAINRYDGFLLTFLFAEASAAVVGGFVASRRPENLVGWLISAHALCFTLGEFTRQYAINGLLVEPGALPLATVASSVPHWIWLPGLMLMVVFLPLYFPDGRLASPRWRPVARLAVLVTALITVAAFVRPGGGEVEVERPGTGEVLGVSNPLGWEGLGNLGPLSDALAVLMPLSWTGLGVVAAASLVVRFRRSRGVERQQIKWVAYAFVLLISLTAANVAVPQRFLPVVVDEILFVATLEVLWVSIAVAVLRYRLYDVDFLINRTLVYGLLSASLVLVYLASVLVLQTALAALTGSDSGLVVVASTLVTAALFGPLRRRIQGSVDRRFYRGKYDARKTLEDFSAKLRDGSDLDGLAGELLAVTRETMQPAHASLWLKERPQTRAHEVSGP